MEWVVLDEKFSFRISFPSSSAFLLCGPFVSCDVIKSERERMKKSCLFERVQEDR